MGKVLQFTICMALLIATLFYWCVLHVFSPNISFHIATVFAKRDLPPEHPLSVRANAVFQHIVAELDSGFLRAWFKLLLKNDSFTTEFGRVAYAFPAGRVVFNVDVLHEFDDHALAGILSHEMGHLVLHHPWVPILKDAHTEEFEADAFALTFMASAGYDPRALLDLYSEWSDYPGSEMRRNG